MLQTLSWCQIVVRIFPKEGKVTYTDQTQQQKPHKELLEQFEQLREILRNFNQVSFKFKHGKQGQRQGADQ